MLTKEIIDDIYYLDEDLFYDIVCFLEKNNPPKIKINRQVFEQILTTNFVIENPTKILEYFDTIDIRVGIMPVFKQESWSARIYFREKVVIYNDFISREEAILEGMKEAVKIYRELKHNKDVLLRKTKSGLAHED